MMDSLQPEVYTAARHGLHRALFVPSRARQRAMRDVVWESNNREYGQADGMSLSQRLSTPSTYGR